MATKKRGKGRPEWTEYRLHIDAYTPETIPMARLASYLTELATVMGEPGSVHFARLEGGSTAPVSRVAREAVPKVDERLLKLEQGGAPADAVKANAAINRLLQADNAKGVLKRTGRRRPVLIFPGREAAVQRPIAVQQHSTIQGKLVRVGGADQTIHATLKSEDRVVSGIRMGEAMAKRLAHHLFDYVRLSGPARWVRDQDGTWSLEDFKVEGFEPLTDAPLSHVLDKIRGIGTGWGDDEDVMTQLHEIRHGPAEQPSVRH